MTALLGIDRLETTGLWRAEPGAQRREVYVAIGESELVVQDQSGTALSHWSLPAVVRLNPGEAPARYAPARRADEELEIAEPEMIAALDRVVAAVELGRRRPGRLRRILIGLTLGLLAGFGAMWLPGALREQAAGLMPAAKRVEIGDRMLEELTLLTGPPCASVTGREALDQLRNRLLPITPARVEVLRDLPHPALALPGNVLVLSDAPLVTQDDPDVVAGHLLAAALTARAAPPVVDFLDELGALELARLLLNGEISDENITGQVERILVAAPPLASAGELRQGFLAARLAWAPYAEAVNLPSGEAAPAEMPPALDDLGWQRLREICDG
ncbi:MAG: hypothetical protein WBA67_16610 [Jannaschia sp.]